MNAVKTVKRRQTNRREILLEAAARRFVEDGYTAASMRDIARDAGMQPGSIYYHFASKEELLVAVHEDGMRLITDTVLATLAGAEAKSAWDRLEAACIAHLQVLLEGGERIKAVMRNVPLKSHPSRDHITQMRDEYEAIFAALLGELALPEGTDPRALRLMLLGAMNWSFTWYREGAESPAHIARKFLSMLRRQLDGGARK
ncbi:MAG: TetR/AcrR family transcriptional regulator [Alphaproteobacteria bacterium]